MFIECKFDREIMTILFSYSFRNRPKETASAPSHPSWSGLPADILTTIFRQLNTHFDLLRFRAVCSSWRCCLPLSLSPPPTFPLPSSSVHVRPCSPAQLAVFHSTVFRISPASSSSSSSSSFLTNLCFSKTPNSISLLNPLTTTKITPPSPTNAIISLLDFCISKITDSYYLKFLTPDESPVYVRKVVVLPDLTVLLLSLGGRLERWRIGDKKWTPVTRHSNNKRDRSCYFEDVMWFKNECFALDISGILVKFDSDFNPVELTDSLAYSSSERKYLVPSGNGDDLYLVSKISDPDPEFFYDYFEDEYRVDERTIDMPIRMSVYKLNWGQRYWDFVGGPDSEAFFIGDDVSFMVSVRDFDGCRADSVYLTDECFWHDDDEDNPYGQDAGLYALDECFVAQLADSPEYASMFWPPPQWLMKQRPKEAVSAPSQSLWSGLPADILTTIFCHLNTHFDLLRFRAVCSSWRCCLPLSLCPPPFPLLLPLPSSSIHVRPSPPAQLAVFHSTVFRLSPATSPSSSSFLVKLCFSNTLNTVSLLNPLTTTKIKPPSPSNTINLLDFRISRIADSYYLKFLTADESGDESPVYVKKVVLLPDSTVLLLSFGGRLERWRIGDEKWMPVSGNSNNKRDRSYHFEDVMWFKNECFAVDISGILVKFESDFNPVELTSSLGYSSSELKYLVPSSNGDDLYLVSKISDPDPELYYDCSEDEYLVDERTIDMPLRMRVYKLNWGQRYWDFAGRSGREVFFIGDDVSFMVSGRDLDGFRPDSVYLTDECFWQDDDKDNPFGQDTGLYALDECFVARLADSPEYARMFWPPPQWLMHHAGSSAI